MSKHIIGAAAYTDHMGQARYNPATGPDAKDLAGLSDEAFNVSSRMHAILKERTSDERRDEAQAYVRAAAGQRGRAGGADRGLMGAGVRRGLMGSSTGMTESGQGLSAFTSNNVNYGTQVSSFRTLDGCKFRTPLCDADLLGFVTTENRAGVAANASFPLAGAAGATTIAEVAVDAGTAGQFQGAYYYWEFRDAASNFVPVAGLLVNVSIGSEQQLVGNIERNGVISSVFALTSTPLQIGWAPWTSIPNLGLILTFGNFLQSADIEVHAFNLWWGNSQKLGGRGGTAPLPPDM